MLQTGTARGPAPRRGTARQPFRRPHQALLPPLVLTQSRRPRRAIATSARTPGPRQSAAISGTLTKSATPDGTGRHRGSATEAPQSAFVMAWDATAFQT